MADGFGSRLSRRERQLMEVLYEKGSASAAEVLEALPDPPSYSSIRALLRILEVKGHVRHTEDGVRYVYQPTQPRRNVARSALEQVVRTFFGGSVGDAVDALVSNADTQLSDDELERLSKLISDARARERAQEEER